MALPLIDIKIFAKGKTFDKLMEQAIEEAVQGPLHEAAKLVRDEAKASIKDAPPAQLVTVHGTTPTGGQFSTTRRQEVRSTPGGPPLARTGNLRAEIFASRNYVGTTRAAFYGRFVEFGTRRAAARPFLVPALERMRPFIAPLMKNLRLPQTRAGRKMAKKKVA